MSRRRLTIAMAVAAGLALEIALHPSLAREEGGRMPHDTASIGAVLQRVAQTHPGQVLKVELEPDEDAASAWAYEVKVLTTTGHVIEIKLDAVSMTVFEVEGLPRERSRED